MKIAIFLPIFIPQRNGVINYILGLYSYTKTLKPDIIPVVITFDINHENILVKQEGDFLTYRLPCYVLLGGTYVIPSIRGLRKFWKIIKAEQFDVVNTHTRFNISSLLGLVLSKKQRIPVYHTEHGSTFVKDNSKLVRFVARLYDETLGRLVISSAHKIFGVSRSCVQFAQKLGGKDGIVIYNGIDGKFWNTSPRIPNPVPNITFCGRMVKGKGLQDLLNALVKLKSDNWKLHLVGDGNYLFKLKELSAELNLNDRIRWHGSQDKESLKSILKITDIFVNPSYTEGLPTSVLEAGAMRCAVIATDVGGTNEVIENNKNGILIPTPESGQNKKMIFAALQLLVKNPELQRKYGDALAAKIEYNFTWETISQQFINHIL